MCREVDPVLIGTLVEEEADAGSSPSARTPVFAADDDADVAMPPPPPPSDAHASDDESWGFGYAGAFAPPARTEPSAILRAVGEGRSFRARVPPSVFSADRPISRSISREYERRGMRRHEYYAECLTGPR
jgi:hypothetical protein